MRVVVHSKLLAPLVLIVALLSLAGMANGGSRDPWVPLHRALRLTMLGAGTPCPVSAKHGVDQGRISGAAGVGPIYPLPSTFSTDGRHPNLLAAKTLWTWPTRLRTRAVRVLVRGRRLDQPGTLRFQLGPQWDTAPLTRELRIDTTQTVGAFSKSTWGTTVTLLFATSPGCYGLQLDSAHGTSIIVVNAAHP